MKLSIVVNATPNATSLAADISLKEAVNLAADIGFTVSLRLILRILMAQVTQLLESYKLKVPALGTGAAYKEGLSLTHPDETRRAKAIERLKAHVDLGAVLEADVIVGLIRGKMSDGLSYDEAVNHITSGLSEVSAYAKQKNVRILLEPINRYEIDLFNTIEDAYSIASQLDDNVGLLIDTFHMNIEESSLMNRFTKGDRIWHVHIADNTRWAPGFGCFDSGVINAEDIEYEGYLQPNTHMPDYKTAFKKVFEYISPVISYRCTMVRM